MSAQPTTFDDLEDDEAWNRTGPRPERMEALDAADVMDQLHTEKCRKCQGTGTFYSYSGRALGQCFACKGKGTKSFKTSPEARSKSRTAAAARRAALPAKNFDAFTAKEPEVAAWLLKASARGSEFASSLRRGVEKYGSLTDPQLASAAKCMDRDAEREAARAAREAEEDATPEGSLDLRSLPSGYYAVPDGDTRLKVRVRHGSGEKWGDWIFVDDGAEYGSRKNYGRQAPGKNYRGGIVEQLTAILADPGGASKAYGKLVGCCGVCGRTLEDQNSIDAGIGPICAQKTGW